MSNFVKKTPFSIQFGNTCNTMEPDYLNLQYKTVPALPIYNSI